MNGVSVMFDHDVGLTSTSIHLLANPGTMIIAAKIKLLHTTGHFTSS